MWRADHRCGVLHRYGLLFLLAVVLSALMRLPQATAMTLATSAAGETRRSGGLAGELPEMAESMPGALQSCGHNELLGAVACIGARTFADSTTELQLATSSALPGVVLAQRTADGRSSLLYSLNGGYSWNTVVLLPWEAVDVLKVRVAVTPRTDAAQPVRFVVLVSVWEPNSRKANYVYRSGDFGRTWAREPLGGWFPGTHEFELSSTRTNPLQLYFSEGGQTYHAPPATDRDNGTVAVSMDGGVSWQPLLSGFEQGERFGAIVPSPHAAGRVYVQVMGNGSWRQSDDGGQHWTRRDFQSTQLAPDAQNADWLHGIDLAGGGTRSIDGGATWIDWAHQPECGDSSIRLVAHPTLSRVLYVQCDAGLYRSRDGGDNWALLSPDPGAAFVADHGMAGRLLWVRADGLWESTNAGTHWVKVTTALSATTSVFLPRVVSRYGR